MKRGKTIEKSSTISDSWAMIVVAAYVLAFILGAIVPFIAHADSNHSNGHDNNSQNSHSNHDNGGHDNGHNGGDNNSHGDNHDNDNHGHDNDHGDDHHGDDHDGDHHGHGDDGYDDTPQTGVLHIIKKTDIGNGTFSFIGSAGIGNFQITTIEGIGSQDFTLAAGTYSVTEDLTDNNLWVLSDSSTNCSEIAITVGGTANCEFDNQAVPQTGGVVVVKNTVGGDGTFSFSGVSSFTLTTVNGTAEQDLYNVPAGSYTLVEANQDGWTATSNSCSEGLNVAAGATTTCTVVNTKNPITPPNDDGVGGGGGEIPSTTSSNSSNGGSNGPIAGSLGTSGGGSIFGGGLVLGASTSTLPELPANCSALLHDYMRINKRNDPEQVKLLQQFLNRELGLNLPVSGFFGKATDAAVRTFQKSHEPQILTPWGITDPTGYVYKTTQRWINLTQCSTLDLPMPVLN